MKRTLLALTWALLMLAPLGLVTATTGCKATPQATAYKTIASVQATVSTALGVWADYVVAQDVKIEGMPPDQREAASNELGDKEAKARGALAAYKIAAKVAINSASDPTKGLASPDMLAEASRFTSLIASLIK